MPKYNREVITGQIRHCEWELKKIRTQRWQYEAEDFKSEQLHWMDRKTHWEHELKELSNDSL